MPDATHRLVDPPQMDVRHLADYMAASKRGERGILQASKYRTLARMIQHKEAQAIVSKFIRDSDTDISWLNEEAERLRNRIADDDFEQLTFNYNADYIDRFAKTFPSIVWPKAEILTPGKRCSIQLYGVKVTLEFHFRLRRTTKTNKIREGAAMLRYAKGKPLPEEVANWQSAFIFGYLGASSVDQSVQPERQLCIIIDAWSGVCHEAPTNSVSRYKDMSAACASIAEQWPNIKAPKGAILAP